MRAQLNITMNTTTDQLLVQGIFHHFVEATVNLLEAASTCTGAASTSYQERTARDGGRGKWTLRRGRCRLRGRL